MAGAQRLERPMQQIESAITYVFWAGIYAWISWYFIVLPLIGR